MSQRVLTPVELTFQSFRHSQGNIRTQLRIFEWMQAAHGILPDLHPNGPELQRYNSYISGAGRHVHLKYETEVLQRTAESGTYDAFKSLRKYWKAEGHPGKCEPAQIAKQLVFDIFAGETEILRQDKPWVNQSNGKDGGRNERLKQRVQSGKSSFLLFYGRDGNPTGQLEFDELYKAVWEPVQLALEDPQRSPTIAEYASKHCDAVFDAEHAIVGKTVLAATNNY